MDGSASAQVCPGALNTLDGTASTKLIGASTSRTRTSTGYRASTARVVLSVKDKPTHLAGLLRVSSKRKAE
ncbi:hypothetical protein HPB50_002696 [Hyalomma asiaticum]|uniref:Uncharacterized protein n=1 Tax=Hyalomma asiaticum TaxID=266040 RepID=A0ACB7TB76_HYAAI|nr:hypothetical protein HPB50_002696 [Hyalomma asiaticum]